VGAATGVVETVDFDERTVTAITRGSASLNQEGIRCAGPFRSRRRGENGVAYDAMVRRAKCEKRNVDAEGDDEEQTAARLADHIQKQR
jgi:hypothetical protein